MPNKIAKILRASEAMHRCHEMLAKEARSLVAYARRRLCQIEEEDPEEVEAEVRQIIAQALLAEAQEMLAEEAKGPTLALIQQDYLEHRINKIDAIKAMIHTKITNSLSEAKRLVESW